MQDKVNLNNNANEIIEIDFGRIFKAIWKRIWLILIVSVLSAVITITGTYFLITPKYESSAMFYVNNNSLSVGDTSFSISQGDIIAAKSLVDTYIVILDSRACLNDVIDYAGVDLEYEDLKDMISASAVNATEIFEVKVTSEDPQQAELLANAIAYILPKRISSIVEGTSANIVDYAVIPTKPSSPSYTTNALIGFLFGLLLMTIIVALREMFDVTIRTSEDIEQCCNHPVLASVPDMLNSSHTGGEYYGYGQKKATRHLASSNKKVNLVGKNISFMASEAYKLLRTKLQFSFVDEITCPVIGVSSALTGEGKSLSSVNIAYSLSQLDKRVLLIDCDMRRPSLASKLPISKVPGLSNYLTGYSDISMVVQRCSLDNESSFDVIASGDNPPNPIELLSSRKMEKILAELKSAYDYIIVDLPPVGEVSDAMVAAKFVDGILLVVRQDYCNTIALSSAVSQFEFIETRILGIVMNCVGEITGKYTRYGRGYYSKYRYSKSYESAYAKADRRAQSTDDKTDIK
ncbi:MAG: polysaccharide biosynthesis tyrosine autokinase [Ruminococcaceae bacterium]|nr:polysaccharide biosynthesis tyrosine autokinase [Oscillospiraceae bacterium]